MKIAVVSDVHANLLALKIALNDIEKENVDKILFLGDYITNGDYENEIISIVKNKASYAILGNREKYILKYSKDMEKYDSYKAISTSYYNLSNESLNYIKSLKETQIIELNNKKILMIHGDKYTKKIINLESMFDEIINDYDFDICLFGHTHEYLNMIYNNKLFLNPGSIGVPCDSPKYKYCILEIKDKVSVKLKEFDTIDTFNQLVLEYKNTNFYKENFIWSNLLFATIKNGRDHFKEFVDIYYSRIKDDMNEKECNNIWNKTFIEYCKNNDIELL